MATTKPIAPDLDSGFVEVPLVSTAVPNVSGSTTRYPIKARFSNPTDDPISITVTDAVGGLAVPAKSVPPHDSISIEFDFCPMNGIKWFASAITLTGKLWGYLTWPF